MNVYINPARLKFRLSSNDDVYWISPSGAEFHIGRYQNWGARTVEYGDSAHSTLVRKWRQYMGTRRVQGASVGPAPIAIRFQRTRYGLLDSECEALGELVTKAIEAYPDEEDEIDEIVRFLNDKGAAHYILDALPNIVSGSVLGGLCGHFHTGPESNTAYRRGDSGTICDECAASSLWRVPDDADDSTYYPRSDLYRHDDGGYYTYEQDEDDDEDDDEDEEDYVRSGTDSNGNPYAAQHSWGTDVTRLGLASAPFQSTDKGQFTIGVELEMQCRNSDDRALFVNELRVKHDNIACKRDGSLDEDRGIELVTTPMEYRTAVDLFKSIEFPSGSTAWDAGNCGIHVHIDSRAFTRLTIAKFLRFWNSPGNEELIRKVAGRYPSQIGVRSDEQAWSYAQVISDLHTEADAVAAQSLLTYKKDYRHGASRYRAVNITNTSPSERDRLDLSVTDDRRFSFSTIEIRIFRASLRKARITAQVEMAAASVYFARSASCNDVSTAAFINWLSGNVSMFPNLASFLGVKKAHVSKDGTTDDRGFENGFKLPVIEAPVAPVPAPPQDAAVSAQGLRNLSEWVETHSRIGRISGTTISGEALIDGTISRSTVWPRVTASEWVQVHDEIAVSIPAPAGEVPA